MKYIQSYILNLSPVKSLEDLHEYVEVGFTPGNVERLYMLSSFYVNDIPIEYTAPRWAKAGDICFFMQSVSSKSILNKLKRELMSIGSGLLRDKKHTEADRMFYYNLLHALSEAEIAYRAFGGKIFAVGKVTSSAWREKNEVGAENHWKSNVYCTYEDVRVLDTPIPLSEFKKLVSFQQQGAITSVLGESYNKVRDLILKKNPRLSSFFKNCISSPIPLKKIDGKNWLTVTKMHEFKFISEDQFRRYYVDYLLAKLKTSGKLYSECYCVAGDMSGKTGKIDNVIALGGKYLPVEVKLNQEIEDHLSAQLKKYYRPSSICLEEDLEISGKECHKAVALIDTLGIYLFKKNKLQRISYLKSITKPKDVDTLKAKLQELLGAL
jgi:hypothetical protein